MIQWKVKVYRSYLEVPQNSRVPYTFCENLDGHELSWNPVTSQLFIFFLFQCKITVTPYPIPHLQLFVHLHLFFHSKKEVGLIQGGPKKLQ